MMKKIGFSFHTLTTHAPPLLPTMEWKIFFAPYRERQLPNVKLKMKRFSSFHTNTQALLPVWIQIENSFSSFHRTLSTNHEFPSYFSKKFRFSQLPLHIGNKHLVLLQIFQNNFNFFLIFVSVHRVKILWPHFKNS